MRVGPLHAISEDATVGGLFVQIRLELVKRVGRFELTSVQGGSVADDNLRRVLVGHDDSWLWQLGTNSVWVVDHQGLLGHAHMMILLLLIGLPVAPQKYNIRII